VISKEKRLIMEKAHKAVGIALRDGDLKKQLCEVCRRSPAFAHHDDYSKPLKVRWLCVRHHLQAHGKNIEEYPANDQDQVLQDQPARVKGRVRIASECVGTRLGSKTWRIS
jgi:ribosomal protein S27AE